jgi:hypothetical protein
MSQVHVNATPQEMAWAEYPLTKARFLVASTNPSRPHHPPRTASSSNTDHGDVTNSDFELYAAVAHDIVLLY